MYSRLGANDSAEYDKLKDALLKRFHLNEHGFRLKFRSAKPDNDESALQFAVRLDNLLTRWVDMAKTEKKYDSLKDLLLREQFLNCCSENLALLLKERKPFSVTEMAHFAEQYSDAHGNFGSFPSDRRQQQQQYANIKRPDNRQAIRQPYSQNSNMRRFSNSNTNPSASNTSHQRTVTCFICHKQGHYARDCRTRPRDHITKVANIIASALTGLLGEDGSELYKPPTSPDHTGQKSSATTKTPETI